METSTTHSSKTSQVITMKLCMFDYVRATNTCWLVGIRPLGVAPHIREIYTSCDFSSFRPAFLSAFLLYCLFFLCNCTGQMDRNNFTHKGSEDAVRRKEVPSQQVFFSHVPFWGSFCPKTPKMSPPSREIPARYKKSNNV